MNEIIFKIDFSEEWDVSISTENSDYEFLNRKYMEDGHGYGYIRVISWITEISRIVKANGDYAIFVSGDN